MTGAEFERYIANLFYKNGFWVLRIPKNERGAQPFDILAIKGNTIYALDCKVCAKKSFPIDRIEDNQWISMEVIKQRTEAVAGFVIYHSDKIYFITYEEAAKSSCVSIVLDDNHLWKIKGE